MRSELDGTIRKQLRTAVLSGFPTFGQLKIIVGSLSHDLSALVTNAPYGEQVDELVTAAFGWLIELCAELVRARPNNPEVSDPIRTVKTWLERRQDSLVRRRHGDSISEPYDAFLGSYSIAPTAGF